MVLRDILKQIDELQNEINSYRPLSREILKQLKEYYRIGLTYSSNAIEGNSLTESETKIVLEEGITIAGKPLKDHYEAMGHSEAFDYLFRLAKSKTISEKDILNLHKLFYYRINRKMAGKYRKTGVFITGSEAVLPPPSKVKPLMSEFADKVLQLRKQYHPVEYAAVIHKDFILIHPFEDGNGRTSRLLMNLALIQGGYEIIIIPPVLKNEYIQALRLCDKGNDEMFIKLIAGLEIESQKDYLRLIRTMLQK